MAAEELLYSAIVDFETQGVSDAINDAERVEKAISDLDATVDVGVTVDDSKINAAADVIADIDAATPSVKVESDNTEIEEAEGILGRIGDTVKGFAVGGAVAGIAGGAVGVLLGASGVGGLLEIDDALASIEGRTGRMIPGAEQLISDLYTDGWGESRQQIADTIVEATNLGIAQEDLAEATESAFQVTSVTGGETNETLRAMDSLVKNGLAPNFEAAGDIIVTGFQNGGDRGQDFLDTLNEYGSTFSGIGLTAEESLAIIVSGTNAGIDNSDRLADGLRVMRENLALVGSDPEVTAAFNTLDSLSDVDLSALFEGYKEGTVTAGEFYDGFFTALGDAHAVDPAAAQAAADDIIGTQATDFGADRFAQVTTVSTGLFAPVEGAAARSAEAMSSTLSQKIDLAVRNINQSIVDWLASDAINLDDFLANLETGINDAIAVLQGGGSIEDAITVGLRPLGFDDEFQKLEAIFGNLVINFLEIVSGVQSLLGKDNSGTRAEIARLSAQQLTFDLQSADIENIPDIVQTALDRGVDASKISELANQSIVELVDAGDIDRAKELATSIELVAGTVTLTQGPFTQILDVVQGADESLEDFNARLEAARQSAEAQGIEFEVTMLPQIDLDAAQEALDSIVSKSGIKPPPEFNQLTALADAYGPSAANFQNPNPINEVVEEPGKGASQFFTDIQEEGDAALSYWEQLQQTAIDAVTGTNESVDSMATTAQEADTAIATALTGNTVTASFEEVARVVQQTMLESAAYIELFGRQVEEIDDKIASLLANMAAGFSSLSGTIAGAVTNFGAATASSQTLNVNQTFNTTSDAQAAAAGTMTLDGLRGFS